MAKRNMFSKINVYLIEYAICSLIRQKYKNMFIFLVLSILIFLLSSIFFITNSIKHEVQSTLSSLPQIIVQNLKGAKVSNINKNMVDSLLLIEGVSDANARVWGYYYFEHAGVNFSLVGIDEFENQYSKTLAKIVNRFNFDANSSMFIGEGVQKIMNQNYYKDYFNFIKNDGSVKKVSFAGVFDADTSLESNDMIVMKKGDVREIFDMNEDEASDVVVSVANPNEIITLALKIKTMYPNVRVITNQDLQVSYEQLYDYKSGVFLVLFVIAIFTFFIIVFDKASGVSSQEKKEIGILKAIGWRVEDVLKEKFYEAFVVSFFAYLVGVILACGFVYILQAPLLANIFTGYSELVPRFELPFILDIQTFALVFFLSVPVYISAIIIPSWKIATLDADEVLR